MPNSWRLDFETHYILLFNITEKDIHSEIIRFLFLPQGYGTLKKTKLSNLLRIKSVYDNDCFTSKNYTCIIINSTDKNKPCWDGIKVHCRVGVLRCRVVLLRSWEEVVGTQGKLKHRCPTFGLIEWDSITRPALERTGHNQNKRWTCVLFFFSFRSPSPMFVTDLFLFWFCCS